jgi:hypothetical protein
VSITVEFLIVYITTKFFGWPSTSLEEFLLRIVSLALGVFLTYFFIMYFLIKKETSIRIRRLDLELLKDTLSTAKAFFATSTIRFNEWFDPVSQVYFSIIINHQLHDPNFHHARVFLFFTEAEIKNLDSFYLDGYYSKCLAEMHLNLNIPAAFLQRNEIKNVLKKLTDEDKRSLGCYQRWIPYGLSWNRNNGICLKKYYLRWNCKRSKLDFAFVELLDGSKRVLCVSKQGQDVLIQRIEEPNLILPYEHLITEIKKEIYVAGAVPPKIRVEHDFTNLSTIG